MRPQRLRTPLVLSAALLIGAGAVLIPLIASNGPNSERAALIRANATDLACLKRAVEGSPEIGSDRPFDPTQADVKRLATRVERARALTFAEVPPVTFVSPEQMEELGAEGGPADHQVLFTDELILTALGAIDPGSDLEALTSGAGVLQGFYEPATGEVVVATDDSVGVSTGHELVHLLTDQALRFPEATGTPRDFDDEDVALDALIEGDATFTSSLLSLRGALETGLTALTIPEEGVPHFLAREGLFPYVEGLGFVCHLYEAGGWDAVNAAYEAPPTTTAQILDVRRFLRGEHPVDPRDPDPPLGWTGDYNQSWGASSLMFLFEAPGGAVDRGLDRPRERAAAWSGGEVHAYLSGSDHAVALTLIQRAGERSLCDSVEEWYRAAFPDDEEVARRGGAERMALRGELQDAVLRCDGRDVRLATAPSIGEARQFVA